MTSPTMWPPAPQGHPASPTYPFPQAPVQAPQGPLPPAYIPPGYGGGPGGGPHGHKPGKHTGVKLMAAVAAVSALVAGGTHWALTHDRSHEAAVGASSTSQTPGVSHDPYAMDGKPTGYVSHPSQPLPISEIGTTSDYVTKVDTGEGTFPVDNLDTTIKAGTQFTTKGGGVYGSSPVCVMGPAIKIDPRMDNRAANDPTMAMRWTVTAGNCAAIPGADVFINVRGDLVKVGEVDGGISNDDTSQIRLNDNIKVDPTLEVKGQTYTSDRKPGAALFETVQPGYRAVVITGPRPEDQINAVITAVHDADGGKYRIFIGLAEGAKHLIQKDRGAPVMAVGDEVDHPLVIGTVTDTRDPAMIEVVPFDNKIEPYANTEIVHN